MRSPFDLLRAASRALRTPVAVVVAAFVLAGLVGIGWGLPASDAWAADAITPRAAGLGAIAETYLPGHHHQYPPLHMLLLTLLSLPWIAAAAARAVGGGASGGVEDALARALIEPGPMTGIEIGARVVAVAMGGAIVWSTYALWTRLVGRAGGLAGAATVATNAVLVYYAHTGNLNLPYLFWSSLALLALDRVLAGEGGETEALLLATAAVLTKDQAAGIFLAVVPCALVVAHRRGRGRRAWRAVAWSALAYAVVSGMLVNPRGFAARLGVLFGPASQDWATYPRGLGGAFAIVRDMALAVPRFSSWGVALAAAVGVAMVLAGRPRLAPGRLRLAMPLVAAASFTLFFTIGARRTEDRFLLPQAVLLFPYAAVPVAAWLARGWSRIPLGVLGAAALAPSVLGVASMDATLLADARYEAERFLAALPAGTSVEVYGGPHFLPRLPDHLRLARAGSDDPDARSHLPGVVEILDPKMDPRPRAPSFIVLSTEFSNTAVGSQTPRAMYGVTSYTDEASRAFFAALFSGALGYDRVLRATCHVPRPLACREVHGSTGGEVWIYARRATP